MTVETAQRRLLEALADLHHGRTSFGQADDPLTALYLGLDHARYLSREQDQNGPLWPLFTALQDLVLAVREDLDPADRPAWAPYSR